MFTTIIFYMTPVTLFFLHLYIHKHYREELNNFLEIAGDFFNEIYANIESINENAAETEYNEFFTVKKNI